MAGFLESVIKKLDEAIENTTQYIDQSNSAKTLPNVEQDLTESVEKLIEEIAKIKTED